MEISSESVTALKIELTYTWADELTFFDLTESTISEGDINLRITHSFDPNFPSLEGPPEKLPVFEAYTPSNMPELANVDSLTLRRSPRFCAKQKPELLTTALSYFTMLSLVTLHSGLIKMSLSCSIFPGVVVEGAFSFPLFDSMPVGNIRGVDNHITTKR